MKRTIAAPAVLVAIAIGFGVGAAQTRPPAVSTEASPSNIDLQRLLSAATTPEDHHKIAVYYLQSAERLEQERPITRRWRKSTGPIHPAS